MLAVFSASFQLIMVSFSYLDSFVIKILLKVSAFLYHPQILLCLVILCHLHAELLIKARIPVFLNLIFHLSGKSQHPAFCFWINSQCGQPFEPCHGVVVIGTGKGIKNFLFLNTQIHDYAVLSFSFSCGVHRCPAS